MDADKALRTTRSVRKRLDFDRPIAPEVIEECLEIALQSPSGSNRQHWHFMVVTEPAKIAAIAGYYRGVFEAYVAMQDDLPSPYPEGDMRVEQGERVRESAVHLAENMQRCPALLIACIEGRPEDPSPAAQAGLYGSVLPAAWSFMVAARVRGIGMAWTTLHLPREKEVAELLGIPEDVIQTVLLPMAYFTGEDFQPAERLPLSEVVHWNAWGNRSP